jgi:tRNA C32,U32 (ribose-2'-O)-methylase TrmJ
VSCSILLVDPKYGFNVGGAVRAAALFGASSVRWTGTRVPYATGKWRLPREERMKDYKHVAFSPTAETPAEQIRVAWESAGLTPVSVERRENAESLDVFEHPERALYVFGPEDGTLGRGVLEACHRFVVIPTEMRTPLNLAAAVNVVLYDRYVKRLHRS